MVHTNTISQGWEGKAALFLYLIENIIMAIWYPRKSMSVIVIAKDLSWNILLLPESLRRCWFKFSWTRCLHLHTAVTRARQSFRVHELLISYVPLTQYEQGLMTRYSLAVV